MDTMTQEKDRGRRGGGTREMGMLGIQHVLLSTIISYKGGPKQMRLCVCTVLKIKRQKSGEGKSIFKTAFKSRREGVYRKKNRMCKCLGGLKMYKLNVDVTLQAIN